MFYKIASIAKNTFIETARQPIYAIIIIIAVLLFIISPSISMYTMDDDNKLLRELGLSTLFLAGLFISIFTSSAAITEEFQSRTILTILSKPIARPIYIIGKFLGIVAAVVLAHYICTIAYIFSVRHGVMETASDTLDLTVIGAAALVIGLSIIIAAFLNFSYDWKFSSSAIYLTAALSTFALVFLALIDRHWKFNPAANGIYAFDIYASILLLMAVIVLCSLAVMFSTRFNVVLTLFLCSAVFVLGLIRDWVFGRFADVYLWARIGRILVPSMQVFWISDAIYEGVSVPAGYIMIAASYALGYTAAALLIAIALFQHRQPAQ